MLMVRTHNHHVGNDLWDLHVASPANPISLSLSPSSLMCHKCAKPHKVLSKDFPSTVKYMYTTVSLFNCQGIFLLTKFTCWSMGYSPYHKIQPVGGISLFTFITKMSTFGVSLISYVFNSWGVMLNMFSSLLVPCLITQIERITD